MSHVLVHVVDVRSEEKVAEKAKDAIKNGQVETLRELLKDENLKNDQAELFLLLKLVVENKHEPRICIDLADSLLTHLPKQAYGAIFHHAAKFGCVEVLDLLIKNYNVSANTLSTLCETALHSIIRGASQHKCIDDQARKCMKLLAETHNIDVNRQDLKQRYTAVHLAAFLKCWNLVRYLISDTVRADIDIVIKVGDVDQSARDLLKAESTIEEQFITNYVSPERSPRSDCVFELFQLLENEDEFIEAIKAMEPQEYQQLINSSNGEHTLLQAASNGGLHRAVGLLIQKGADVNYSAGLTHAPVFLAIQKGYLEVLEVLLSAPRINLSLENNWNNKRSPLHVAVLEQGFNTRFMELLLRADKKKKLNIDALDYAQFSALHYAAKANKIDAAQLLLRHRAKIFFINDTFNKDRPVLYDLKADAVSEYLDQHVTLEGAPSNEKYALVFDYSILTPPTKPKEEHWDVSSNDSSCCCPFLEPYELCSETKALLQMAESKDHKTLLNHPLIKSYLHLKWHKMRKLYWFNLVIYGLFTVFLTLHIYSRVHYGANDGHLDNNGTLTCLTKQFDVKLNNLAIITDVVASIPLVLLWLREAVQVLTSRLKYIYEIDNWFEVPLFCITSMLLWASYVLPETCLHWLAALAVVLAYLVLIRLLGRHPLLATYFTMFFRVCKSFFCFLLWYILLVFAFGFAFYVTIPGCNDKKEPNLFYYFPTSIFKTLIMLSGELEAGEIDFEFLTGISHIIFILFIFFIPIVLINLLNGLAVSDTQAIRNEAEVVSCVSQVELFAKIESTRVWKYFLECCISDLPRNYLKVFLNDNNRMEPPLDTCHGGPSQMANLPCGTFCPVFDKLVKEARMAATRREQLSESTELLQRIEEYLRNKFNETGSVGAELLRRQSELDRSIESIIQALKSQPR